MRVPYPQSRPLGVPASREFNMATRACHEPVPPSYRVRYAPLSASIAIFVMLLGCSGFSRTGVAAVTRVSQIETGGGIACLIDGHQFGPISYRVQDIGQRGVPMPSHADLIMLRRILHYVHSTKLRFVYVGRPRQEFLVYNATLGPCTAIIPGYQVLNSPYCKAAWAPLAGTGAMPDCWTPPRPWIPGDRGKDSPR
jgi:Ni,Fe-hydrogenase III small subunit